VLPAATRRRSRGRTAAYRSLAMTTLDACIDGVTRRLCARSARSRLS
jgi:hypothetical protein